MSRKAGFPTSSCSIRLPDGGVSGGSRDEGGVSGTDSGDDSSYKKRQQLISFGHSQWGFNNWSWGVTRQDLDFVDFANGKYSAGVVAFVTVKVNSLGIYREDVGYATCVNSQKGAAVYSARRCSVTNALREALLGFGGDVAASLWEQLEAKKSEGQCEDSFRPNGNTSNNSEVNGNNRHNHTNNGGQKNTTLFHRNDRHNHPQRKDSSDSSASIDSKNIKIHSKSPHRQDPSASNKFDKSAPNAGKPLPLHENNTVDHMTNKTSGTTANHTRQPSGAPPMAVVGVPSSPMSVHPPVPLHPSNVNVKQEDCNDVKMSSDEELRAERKRRQKQKQEAFKKKLQND